MFSIVMFKVFSVIKLAYLKQAAPKQRAKVARRVLSKHGPFKNGFYVSGPLPGWQCCQKVHKSLSHQRLMPPKSVFKKHEIPKMQELHIIYGVLPAFLATSL